MKFTFQVEHSSSELFKADAKVCFDFIARVHVYTHDYIRFADTKASAVLAASGFLFSGLLTRGDALGVILRNSPSLQLTCCAVFFGVCALIGLVLTIGFCVACVMPRLNSHGSGLVYWDQVAKQQGYVQLVTTLSGEAAVEQLAEHVKAVSKTAQRKYTFVSRALWSLCATLSFALLFSIFVVWITVLTVP
jgi:hypothetical protein